MNFSISYDDNYQSYQTTCLFSEMETDPNPPLNNSNIGYVSSLFDTSSNNNHGLMFGNYEPSSNENVVNGMSSSLPLYSPITLPESDFISPFNISYPVSTIIVDDPTPSSQDTIYESANDTINEIPQSSDSQPTVLSDVTTKDVSIDDSYDSTTNDDDFIPLDEDISNNASSKRRNNWTVEECNLLKRAVQIYGCENRWSDIAKFVSTRTVSQCVNKWNNDLSKKHKRWNKEASRRLDAIIKHTTDIKDIMKLMPDHTYIQIYQQLQKRNCMNRPWKDEEISMLISMKKNKMSNAKIGHSLNRNSDDIKNMVKKLENRGVL